VRNAANATELRAVAGKESVALEVLEMDVTDEASVDRAVHSVVEQAGRIDVAINNAGASAANAQDVADAVLAIVETPAGQRQLRYRVSPADLGVDAINEVCAQTQSRFLEAFGLTPETTFTRSKSAMAD
jgi:NAD(P)-dependent dehydrogenase (short-subunit alcohol dehydrogenase family)